jgi:hypothetical protein
MNMRTSLLLVLFTFCIARPVVAQQEAETSTQVEARIEDFAFLTGYWVGEGFGGVSEEMWMPPVDGRMQGIYKHSSNSALMFSELLDISSEHGQIRLRLKHFNPDLTGWEEKNDHVTFPLESVAPNKATFRGLSYELVGKDQLRIELTLRESDGSTHVEVFNLTRRPL